MITIYDRYYAKDGTLEYERQRRVAFPIAEMLEFEVWNIEGFHQKVIAEFLVEEGYSITFSEFQIDGMGVILKEVTAKLNPKLDRKYRVRELRKRPWPSIIYWPVFYF